MKEPAIRKGKRPRKFRLLWAYGILSYERHPIRAVFPLHAAKISRLRYRTPRWDPA